MQCEFYGGTSENNKSIIRGGYSIDKKDARLNSYYVPIGLHHHGEDSYMEDPIDEFDPTYHDEYLPLDQGHIDEMLYIVMVPSTQKRANRTRKNRGKK